MILYLLALEDKFVKRNTFNKLAFIRKYESPTHTSSGDKKLTSSKSIIIVSLIIFCLATFTGVKKDLPCPNDFLCEKPQVLPNN